MGLFLKCYDRNATPSVCHFQEPAGLVRIAPPRINDVVKITIIARGRGVTVIRRLYMLACMKGK